VPLSISVIPYFGRVSEAALREVDRGLIEAVRAMGGENWTIIREALVAEALPSLIAGFTVTLVLLVDACAMAGAVGAGSLGDLAIHQQSRHPSRTPCCGAGGQESRSLSSMSIDIDL
jgi:D-methionine transport system permease protein